MLPCGLRNALHAVLHRTFLASSILYPRHNSRSWSDSSMLDKGLPVYHVTMLPNVSRSHLALPGARSRGHLESPCLILGSTRCSDARLDAKAQKCPLIFRALLDLSASSSVDSCLGLLWEASGPVPFYVQRPGPQWLGSGASKLLLVQQALHPWMTVTHQTHIIP